MASWADEEVDPPQEDVSSQEPAEDGQGYRTRKGRHEDLLRLLQVPMPVPISSLVNGRPVAGVVTKRMDSYGFLASPDFEGNLFFHFRQTDCADADIYEGACFEFDVAMDNRSGKPIALRMARLADGAVSGDMTHSQEMIGVVTRCSAESRRGRDRGNSTMGKIQFEMEGYMFQLAYFNEDVVGEPSLEVEDEVRFNVCYNPIARKLRAKSVTFVRRPEVPRYQGVVVSVKANGYGFIASAEEGEQLFFHVSQFQSETAEEPMPRLNDEVEFKKTTANNKLTAMDVRLLPKGTVSLYETETEDRLAVVTACEARLHRDQDTVFDRAGRVCLINYTPEATCFDLPLRPELEYYFGQSTNSVDADPATSPWFEAALEVGDVVQCRVAKARRSGKLAAVAVRKCETEDEQVLAVAARASESRYVGVVEAVTFPDAGVRRGGRSPRGGRTEGPSTAIKVIGRQLPTGVMNEHIRERGQVVVHADNGRGARTPRMFPGDEVAFGLEKDSRARSPRVKSVKLVTAIDDTAQRQTGKVSSLKDKYGFIETPNAREERFFHYSELDVPDNQLEIGMWMSYVTAKDGDGKTIACRLHQVDSADVNVVEVLEPGLYVGEVKRVTGSVDHPRGRLKVLEVPAVEAAPVEPAVVFADGQPEGTTTSEATATATEVNAEAVSDAVDATPSMSSVVAAANAATEPAATSASQPSDADAKGAAAEDSTTTTAADGDQAPEQFADADETKSVLKVKVGSEIPFGVGTLVQADQKLRAGDRVQFRVVLCEHDLPKAVALKKLNRPAPEPEVNLHGQVIVIREKHGLIMSEKYKKLHFPLNVIEEQSRLGPKDEVEFDVEMNERNGRPQASRVKLIKRYVPSERPEALKRFGKGVAKASAQTSTQPMNIKRQPSLPNVGEGFGAGRGRPLADASQA
eukprot:TRINITY_DN9187_c0_g1_i1.p1 TRINITY_DN9187_c0_g1~~TRINITY_DN9187_c0_g1_i1.p1  ORF type:complete len:933 (+),score=225.17 TRINITY_DN9187_c0_g1_i1:46-2799(+)